MKLSTFHKCIGHLNFFFREASIPTMHMVPAAEEALIERAVAGLDKSSLSPNITQILPGHASSSWSQEFVVPTNVLWEIVGVWLYAFFVENPNFHWLFNKLRSSLHLSAESKWTCIKCIKEVIQSSKSVLWKALCSTIWWMYQGPFNVITVPFHGTHSRCWPPPRLKF
jgi:hypothetical protein